MELDSETFAVGEQAELVPPVEHFSSFLGWIQDLLLYRTSLLTPEPGEGLKYLLSLITTGSCKVQKSRAVDRLKSHINKTHHAIVLYNESITALDCVELLCIPFL
jgi:hypothetical protein